MPYIFDNGTHIVMFQARYGRHVTKRPVMSANPLFHGEVKSLITMMRWHIDPVNKGWPLIGSLHGNPMAGCAVLIVYRDPFFYFFNTSGLFPAHQQRLEYHK
ncbi:hypothetical protein AN401_07605 [Zobellella denitrificans]|uniref:Uncharacterized protein n=1 Tax=Zobellella denitrificans TaxID=347534 RepID=A0A291HNM4_9GAMM|nr:hypothetical protein AN401_07605 [Zobellella denitrificans]